MNNKIARRIKDLSELYGDSPDEKRRLYKKSGTTIHIPLKANRIKNNATASEVYQVALAMLKQENGE